jgi:sialate O-acetylesterase
MKSISLKLTTTLFFTVILLSCQKPFIKLPALVSDHMVLQQLDTVNIWGWSAPEQEISITTSWNNGSYIVTADENGKWIAQVPTTKAGGPYQIIISSDTVITLNDVLLGEVWICSGQSNMEWELIKAATGSEEITQADIPQMRLFQVEKAVSLTPQEDLTGKWELCTPESAKKFSAIGYFFGKELNTALNVPIGLIHSSWGGTPSEAWTSAETLKQFDVYREKLEKLEKDSLIKMENAISIQDSLTRSRKELIDFNNENTIGKKEKWMASSYNDNEWPKVEVPGEWSTLSEIGMMEGVVWFRKTIALPKDWSQKNLKLELGPIDEMDQTYVNGTLVGENDVIGNWNMPRIYEVPANIISGDSLTIAIRVINTYLQGGIFGAPELLKLYPADMPMAAIPLAGKWAYKIAYKFAPLPMLTHPQQPTFLYNAMINPITNMTIKGAIWYQGEANVPRAEEYKEIFPAMITDWRTKWQQGDFPFYYVQIAPFEYGPIDNSAELREAQLLTLEKVKNVGMAVTMDIGNPQDIHPTNKKDVGHRLALWALAKDYGMDLVYSGPIYHHHEISGSTIRVTFDQIGSGLFAEKGAATHFEIAGEDGIFYPAHTLIDYDAVIVSSSKVKAPKAVRFAWSNTAQPNLFNEEGLPASSFRTIETKRMTENDF